MSQHNNVSSITIDEDRTITIKADTVQYMHLSFYLYMTKLLLLYYISFLQICAMLNVREINTFSSM